MNHFLTKKMIDRLYMTMKRKNISSNKICKALNIEYPAYKAMLEGKSPCYNKRQTKIAEVLDVDRAELFKEFIQ